MSKRKMRRDPFEQQIELAFSPGSFIRDRECFSFVSGVEAVANQIDTLVEVDAELAARL
jgi:hypothetical protein